MPGTCTLFKISLFRKEFAQLMGKKRCVWEKETSKRTGLVCLFMGPGPVLKLLDSGHWFIRYFELCMLQIVFEKTLKQLSILDIENYGFI